MREELAEIVGFEMADPRLGMVDVTEVHVAPDLRHAHVRVASSGGPQEQERALVALEHARNFLRRELARRLNLRRMPELHFEPAPGAEEAARVDLLLKRARRTRGKDEDPVP